MCERGWLHPSTRRRDPLQITLSARSRRSDLTIVARASNASAAPKISFLAGADRVVQPQTDVGLHMVETLSLKPQVADFLIVATAGGPVAGLRFEEIVVMLSVPGRPLPATLPGRTAPRSSRRGGGWSVQRYEKLMWSSRLDALIGDGDDAGRCAGSRPSRCGTGALRPRPVSLALSR